MTRFIRAGIALVVLAAAVAACREYMPVNRYMRPRAAPSTSTTDARHKFDHERHAKVLKQEGLACGDCHRFDAQIEASEEALAGTASKAALYPGSAACHHCHGPSETRFAAAPSACTTCHSNLLALLPDNHQIGWLRAHSAIAAADPVACQSCHRDSFCIDCHQNRDPILTFGHDRNFLSMHSVDARANPIQCGNCHREDFCRSCHANTIK